MSHMSKIFFKGLDSKFETGSCGHWMRFFFFAGNDTWSMLAPLWPSFPSTGWDHWIRHGVPFLSHRDCVAPEVPRSKHVDTKGTNVKAGSGIYKLLEKMAFSKLPHGELKDVSYLERHGESKKKSLNDTNIAENRVSLWISEFYSMRDVCCR